MFYETYIYNGGSLHTWQKQNNTTFPSSALFGDKLKLYRTAVSSDKVCGISKPNNTANGEKFSLICQVVFQIKGRRNNAGHWQKAEALDKFCEITGLRKEYDKDMQYAKIEPIKDLFIKDIKQVNAFTISGTFSVENEELFKTAYNKGIGLRKSYGYGLLIVL